MIGFLIYLPTLAKMPHALFALAILAAYYRFWQKWRGPGLYPEFDNNRFDFGILLLIVALSAFNFVFGHGIRQTFNESVPGFIMLPFTFLVALSIRKVDIKIFVSLAVIEALSIYAEYSLGISTFFSNLTRYTEFGDSDLQYYNKPLGLSYNSSIAAAKMFLSLMLIDLLTLKRTFKIIIQIGFAAAIFLTFNRTVFLSVMVYIVLSTLHTVFWKKLTAVRWNLLIAAGFTTVFIAGYLVVDNLDVIVGQLTRSRGSFEFSGRDKIWTYFIDFIRENPFFGNNGEKLYFGRYHAHNSFIQLIATNGILISLLYFYIIFRNVRYNNLILVLSILTYSFFQYGIFWGISVMDIYFFFFLFKLKNPEEQKELGFNTLN